ncbi:MAG: site-specific DNA-methyltransferase [Dehalococcoidia bacterium]
MGRRTATSDSAPAHTLQIQDLPLDALRPDPANPRRIADEELDALTRSIREFGLVDPLIARRDDHTVIGGHQRLVAARRAGLITVPVILLDLSPDRAHLLNLALNRIGGSWDEPLLARLIAELDAIPELDLALTGFSDQELQSLLLQLEASEKQAQPETFDFEAALEGARVSSRVKRGDLWQLGPHRLLCGDSTDPDDVTRLLEGERAQLAFTDPPYNVAYGDHGGQRRGSRRRRIANDAMSPEQFEVFCRSWVASLVDHVDGGLYICMSSKEWPLVARLLAEAGAHWSDTIIWAKDRFTLGRADYQRQYELIWYGWRAGAEHYWCGDRDQGDVWEVARPSASVLHPTMKPLPLVERALTNSSRPGDRVLDLFLGSGTTLVAAARTARTCLAIELDPIYVDVAIARWEAFTGEVARRERRR